jgi:hypothetical protein
MKKIFSRLLLLSIGISTFTSSCKKESGGNSNTGPDVLLLTDGLLCTTGIYRGQLDTLVYYPHFGKLDGYQYGGTGSEHKVFTINNSNNSIALKYNPPNTNGGIFLGIIKNSSPSASSFPQNEYLFRNYQDKSGETEFVIKRDKDNISKFSIEAKSHPGYYLGTARWSGNPQNTEESLVFTGTRQLFFFMTQ